MRAKSQLLSASLALAIARRGGRRDDILTKQRREDAHDKRHLPIEDEANDEARKEGRNHLDEK